MIWIVIYNRKPLYISRDVYHNGEVFNFYTNRYRTMSIEDWKDTYNSETLFLSIDVSWDDIVTIEDLRKLAYEQYPELLL